MADTKSERSRSDKIRLDTWEIFEDGALSKTAM